MSRFLKMCFGAAVALVCAQPAWADTCAAGDPAGDVCYDLNLSNALGNQPAGTPYVQVALQQISGTEVQVTVTLNSTLIKDFVKTGSGEVHPTFAFNLNNTPTNNASITGITPGFAESGTFNFSTSDYGSFEYAIDATGGTGGNHQTAGPLVFDVSVTGGLLISNFVANNSNLCMSKGCLFTADVLGQNGGTGLVARMPEAPTPLFFGAGLLGLMVLHRRRLLKPTRTR
jgi:hypothetical protein